MKILWDWLTWKREKVVNLYMPWGDHYEITIIYSYDILIWFPPFVVVLFSLGG